MLAKFILVIQSTIIGFFAGGFYKGLTMPEGSGLAGGATVLFSGIIGEALALFLSLFLVNRLSRSALKRANVIMLLVLLIPIGWIVYRIQTKKPDEGLKPRREVTTPASSRAYASALSNPSSTAEMGLGMVRPDFYQSKALYFYGPITEVKGVEEHLPYDSISFRVEDHHQFSISYAPPWFAPAHLKMDYETLYLKIISLSRDWIQVEVNQYNGQTAWISANEVKVMLWPEFLLGVNSLESKNLQTNPLRVKPFDHAGLFQLSKARLLLIPLLVKDEWLKVRVKKNNSEDAGSAWLRWKKDGQLIVGYSLFL